MKKLNIEGKVVLEAIKTEKGEAVSFEKTTQLLSCLRTPANREVGANFQEMSNVISVLRKIHTASVKKESFALIENAEHETLVRVLKAASFMVIDPATFDWINEIAELKDIEVESK